MAQLIEGTNKVSENLVILWRLHVGTEVGLNEDDSSSSSKRTPHRGFIDFSRPGETKIM